MFRQKNADVKKSTLKIQDPKKDIATRVKHLRIIIDNVDFGEAKGIFEANCSHIYHILYDSFIQAETNLRQRELSFHLVHKAQKEEFECSLWILEQVLSLLPELINRRWQLHSFGRLLSKLLHQGNSVKLRKQAVRYFLMWYQALNENAPAHVHRMFASLVPGVNDEEGATALPGLTSVFHDISLQSPVSATELVPILAPSGTNDRTHEGASSRLFMDFLLESMVSTVVRLEWLDKAAHHHRCFNFLLEQFKIHYLPRLCPHYCYTTSLYRPDLELPKLRKPELDSELVSCRVSLIKWVAGNMHHMKKISSSSADGASLTGGNSGNTGPISLISTTSSHSHVSGNEDEGQHESSPHSLDSVSMQVRQLKDEAVASQIVRDVLCSTPDNVNFIHELYRQAFLLTFANTSHAVAIRKTIAVYKDIIQGASTFELPPYVLEPLENLLVGNAGTPPSSRHTLDDSSSDTSFRSTRLRNDSYLGAIHKENLLVRAGLQNTLQLFTTHAANVFLLDVSPQNATSLEEQTDACKRVLNIYRFMVMNSRMDNYTWEQLLLILLQITSLVLGSSMPGRKGLASKLAQPIFQTLIVTWIKANLNVVISRELWDRFLHVLTSLSNWEDLIKEWAKTMETLTRVLARHVYNLDLTNLPLEQKNKKIRRTGNRPNTIAPSSMAPVQDRNVCRQDSSSFSEDARPLPGEKLEAITSLARSLSETNLAKRHARVTFRQQQRRSHSLDNLRQPDVESGDRTRSPSPAHSNGIESNSIKDSPIQIDVMGEVHPALGNAHYGSNSAHPNLIQHGNSNVLNISYLDEPRGIVCGGAVRGWLPDVAVVLWRRMLGALGDVNKINDARLHAQVFDYLVRLTDTLIRIKMNQGISADNVSTPIAPELVPPITYILPWCFGALTLPNTYESGKLNALRLLCTVTIACDSQHRSYLPHFYRSLHIALSGSSRATLNTAIRYLGPRFLSLPLPGASLLLLDQIHACNSVLNSTDRSQSSPRTEAVSILGNLLSYSDNLRRLSVLQPDESFQVMPCPDVKEHVVSILLRAGRHEPTGMARCIAISSLGLFVYRELTKKTYHSKVVDAMNIIMLALKFNHKMVAQLASNTLFLLCDHATVLWNQYPRLADSVIRALCNALFLHFPLASTAGPNDLALETNLLLCLGEWCMRLGPSRLLTISEYGEPRGSCLLLVVFNVLTRLIRGRSAFEDTESGGLTQPSFNDDFDPNILLDNIEKLAAHSSPSRNAQYELGITLCARTVLSHLVTHLGHFPMAIGAARLSSLVVEHDDVPELHSDELSTAIFSASNIQLFVLNKNVVASFVELPVLDLPCSGVTAGLSTADRQVRVLLRDLSGKVSWDASILYRTPCPSKSSEGIAPSMENIASTTEQRSNSSSLSQLPTGGSSAPTSWGPSSMFQPESLLVNSAVPLLQSSNLQQRAIRHRPPTVLPETSNAAPDLDQLDDLLQYLGHTSPECLDHVERKLNEPTPLFAGRHGAGSDVEAEAIASVISERSMEMEQIAHTHQLSAMLALPASRPQSRSGSVPNRDADMISVSSHCSTNVEQSSFQQCRMLFSQLGLTGWERRKQLYLLHRSERLLRELRNLDSQRCRETHKVAVIYVAPGQEDKNSILSNQGGSTAYEQFLAALAWEVELEGHTGFLGGLQRQGSTGLTAPYHATSFYESIFHVATRMPGETAEAVLSKTRHLGNDEVHVVWSEHYRDYRRDIIPTEFCDILIVIYPLNNHLNRVTINRKPDVPYFGILYDEAIIESNILAGMIRAAIICASRAKRTTLNHYQQYYEERARSLSTVVASHRDSTTFEDFIARVYSPVATPYIPFSAAAVSTATSADIQTSGVQHAGQSKLAAALLDGGNSRARMNSRLESGARRGENIHDGTARSVWFTHPGSISHNLEAVFSISPRPMRKLTTMKANLPKRALRADQSEEVG